MSFAERHFPYGALPPPLPPNQTYRSDGFSPNTRQSTLPSMSNILNPTSGVLEHHQQPAAHQYQPSHAISRESMWQPQAQSQSVSPTQSEQNHYNSPPAPRSYYSQPPIESSLMSQSYSQDSALAYQSSQPIVERRQFKRPKIERVGGSSNYISSERTLSPLQFRSSEPQSNQPHPKDIAPQRFSNGEPSMSRIPNMNQREAPRGQTISGLLTGLPRVQNVPTGPKYVLEMRQDPCAARACGFGERDRRVVDPPPILTMKLADPNPSPEALAVLRRERCAVVHCTLWDPVTNTDASNMPTTTDRRQNRRLMGTLVSSSFSGKDEHNRDGCFFTFPDLSVRTPGKYSLKFKLVILDPRKMIPGAQSIVESVVISKPFDVFNAKDFKGMEKSSALAVTLKAQGCLISVKKGSAKSKAKADRAEEDEDDEDDSD